MHPLLGQGKSPDPLEPQGWAETLPLMAVGGGCWQSHIKSKCVEQWEGAGVQSLYGPRRKD